MPKHITNIQKEEIISYYMSKPMTIYDVSREFNVSEPSIIKILDEYKIKRYSKSKLYSPDLDEYYFDDINTEEKAYFLGLLLTDGNIHHTKGKQCQVSLCLQDSDRYLIEKFKDEIKSNKKITSDGRGCSELAILSNILCDDLKKYGVTERKSLICKFPNNLMLDYYPHLIRGIFDGDGSVSYYSRPGRFSHTKAIRFCSGNYEFLKDLINFLENEVNIIPIAIYREKENLWSIRYSKNESMLKLIEYMYKDAHVYLKRKKHRCDLIYDEINKYGNTEIIR